MMSQPERILQVVNSMNRGGAESLIMNIYRKIDRSRFQFDFLVHIQEDGAFDKEILELGGRIFHAPKYRLWNHFAYCNWLEFFFRCHPEFKIVHGHQYNTASVYLAVAKKMGRRTIAHSHNTSNGHGIIAKVKNVMRKNLNKVVDTKLACSDDAGKWLYGEEASYTIIANGIDCDRYAYNENTREEIRSILGINGRTVVLGNVARFCPVKNHAFLVDVFDEYHKTNPNSKLLLVGDGPLYPDIQKLVTSKGLNEKVIFLGVRSDIPQLMNAMDVFLLPSLHEGLPVTLVEAQAADLPCVVSDCISDEAIIVSEIVKKSLLGNNLTPWIEAISSFAGRKRVDRREMIKQSGFDIGAVANSMARIYSEYL